MKMHLDIAPLKAASPLGIHNKIVLIGSCFSDNIGRRMFERGLDVSFNPTGILYNPISIAQHLQKVPPEAELTQRNGTVYSFFHHSDISARNQDEMHELIREKHKSLFEELSKADLLIITFGSAFVYQMHTDIVVANCHKLPGSSFTKRLLSVEEIVSLYSGLFHELRTANPRLQILFTVSPVKHLRDGVHENNLSKATLLLAIEKITAQNPGTHYFPAYELVNDDLRDYRFYKEDMAHPNEQAINYVWEKFTAAWFDEKAQKFIAIMDRYLKAKAHRPRESEGIENQKFREHLENLEMELRAMHPLLNL